MPANGNGFNNPLQFGTVTDLLVAILNVVIIMLTPIVVFFLIYSGFMYVTARGNPEKIAKASKSLLYGVIGGVIVLGSVAITTIVSNVINQF